MKKKTEEKPITIEFRGFCPEYVTEYAMSVKGKNFIVKYEKKDIPDIYEGLSPKEKKKLEKMVRKRIEKFSYCDVKESLENLSKHLWSIKNAAYSNELHYKISNGVVLTESRAEGGISAKGYKGFFQSNKEDMKPEESIAHGNAELGECFKNNKNVIKALLEYSSGKGNVDKYFEIFRKRHGKEGNALDILNDPYIERFNPVSMAYAVEALAWGEVAKNPDKYLSMIKKKDEKRALMKNRVKLARRQ